MTSTSGVNLEDGQNTYRLMDYIQSTWLLTLDVVRREVFLEHTLSETVQKGIKVVGVLFIIMFILTCRRQSMYVY